MAGRRPDGSTPVNLNRATHECRARWILVDSDRGGGQTTVSIGQLDDGRWYVDRHGSTGDRPRAYPTKQAVWDAAKAWMAATGRRWRRVPCYPATRPATEPDRPAARDRQVDRIGDWVCGGRDGHGVVEPDRSGIVPACPHCGRALLEVVADSRLGQVYRTPDPSTCAAGHRYEPGRCKRGHLPCGMHNGHDTWLCQCGDVQAYPPVGADCRAGRR